MFPRFTHLFVEYIWCVDCPVSVTDFTKIYVYIFLYGLYKYSVFVSVDCSFPYYNWILFLFFISSNMYFLRIKFITNDNNQKKKEKKKMCWFSQMGHKISSLAPQEKRENDHSIQIKVKIHSVLHIPVVYLTLTEKCETNNNNKKIKKYLSTLCVNAAPNISSQAIFIFTHKRWSA